MHLQSHCCLCLKIVLWIRCRWSLQYCVQHNLCFHSTLFLCFWLLLKSILYEFASLKVSSVLSSLLVGFNLLTFWYFLSIWPPGPFKCDDDSLSNTITFLHVDPMLGLALLSDIWMYIPTTMIYERYSYIIYICKLYLNKHDTKYMDK